MFYHVSIHHPKEGKRDALIDSMHRFAAALQHAPGLVSAQTLYDEEQDVLMGLAIWESQAAWRASIHLAREAVADDPFEEWEDQEVDGYRFKDV